MRISHNEMEGFIEEISDQCEVGDPPVVRWCIVTVPNEDGMGAGTVFFVATMYIDGMICELAIETGMADAHVSPGKDNAKIHVEELSQWCTEKNVPLKRGRFEDDG